MKKLTETAREILSNLQQQEGGSSPPICEGAKSAKWPICERAKSANSIFGETAKSAKCPTGVGSERGLQQVNDLAAGWLKHVERVAKDGLGRCPHCHGWDWWACRDGHGHCAGCESPRSHPCESVFQFTTDPALLAEIEGTFQEPVRVIGPYGNATPLWWKQHAETKERVRCQERFRAALERFANRWRYAIHDKNCKLTNLASTKELEPIGSRCGLWVFYPEGGGLEDILERISGQTIFSRARCMGIRRHGNYWHLDAKWSDMKSKYHPIRRGRGNA